jgi:hypothetical protein
MFFSCGEPFLFIRRNIDWGEKKKTVILVKRHVKGKLKIGFSLSSNEIF